MNSVGAMIGTLLPLRNGLPIFFTKQSLIGRSPREPVVIDRCFPKCTEG